MKRRAATKGSEMAKQIVTKSTEYAAMVVEAKASVSTVKDPELRRVAFGKILVTLGSGLRFCDFSLTRPKV